MFGGMRLDLIAPVYHLGFATADAAGQAVLQLTVPNRSRLIGHSLGLQAARANPIQSDKSEAIHVEVQP